MFVDKGADITEVDHYGFNCLFTFIACATGAGTVSEYRALQCLLRIFNDIFARDASGNDVFMYVNELRRWPGKWQDRFDDVLSLDIWFDVEHRDGSCDCGSYRQDLWYCALRRSKLDVLYEIGPYTRIARYSRLYTPYHYLALCYLDSWGELHSDDFEEQIRQVLEEHPSSLSEDEKRIQRELDSEWQARSRT